MNYRRTLWISLGAAATMWAGTAFAATELTLTGPFADKIIGPQSASNPCIIAGTTCQNPDGFGYNQYSPNNAESYDRWSNNQVGPTGGVNVADGVQGTPYTVDQILGVTNNLPFVVAIDSNTAGGQSPHETLTRFEVWDTTTNTLLYFFNGDVDSENIEPSHNGTGFGDYTLGIISLAGLTGTDGILFRAVWDNASDGTESFFIVGVPGPLAGAGLPGLIAACGGLIALARRRRKLVTA